MQYAALKAVIREHIGSGGESRLDIPAPLLREILVAAVRGKSRFDPEFYVRKNPDVRKAIENKEVSSAEDHYFITGYFEGRLPFQIIVDENFYLQHNTDVADAIRRGVPITAQSHFEQAGFLEGRAPFEGFSLFW